MAHLSATLVPVRADHSNNLSVPCPGILASGLSRNHILDIIFIPSEDQPDSCPHMLADEKEVVTRRELTRVFFFILTLLTDSVT